MQLTGHGVCTIPNVYCIPNDNYSKLSNLIFSKHGIKAMDTKINILGVKHINIPVGSMIISYNKHFFFKLCSRVFL